MFEKLKEKSDKLFWSTFSRNWELEDEITYPDNSVFMKAREQYKEGTKKGAQEALRTLDQLDKAEGCPYVQRLIGLCHQKTDEDTSLAIEAMQRGLVGAQKDLSVYYANMAALLVDSERYDEALEYTRIGIELNPKEIANYLNALSAMDYLDDTEGQREMFSTIKEQFPDYAEDEIIRHHLLNDSTLNRFRKQVLTENDLSATD